MRTLRVAGCSAGLLCVAGAIAALCLSAGVAEATSVAWAKTAAGTYSWDVNGNWGGSYPHTSSDGANLALAIAGDQIINMDAGTTINQLSIGDTAGSHTITINPNGGSLIFNNGSNSFALTNYGTAAGGNTITAPITLSSNLAVDYNSGNAGKLTLSGNITAGSKTLTKNGAGTLTLSGANSFGSSGGVTLNAGSLNINSQSAFGNSGATFTIAGGTIDNTSASSFTLNTIPQNWNGDFAFAGTRDLNLGAGAVALSGGRTVTVSAGNLTVGGIISGSGGSLIKEGGGTLILSGANTFGGGVTIDAGTVKLDTGAHTGTGTGIGTLGAAASATLAFGASSTGKLQLNGCNATVAGLSTNATAGTPIIENGSGTGTASVLTVNAATDSTYAGTLRDGAAGTLGLRKSGLGTLRLSGTSGYTGSTTVTAGALLVNGTLSTSTTAVNVNAGGTLGGSGAINRPVTVIADGHLAPGDGLGTLAVAGTTTISGNYDVQLGTPGGSHALAGTSDRTNVTGALTLSGSTLNLSDNVGAGGSGSAGAGSYRIFTQTGAPTGTFGTINNIAGLHAKVDASTSGSVFVDVYRLASASSATSVDLGRVIGNAGFTSQTVSVTNAAANDGFSEKLSGSVAHSGAATASGSFNALTAGQSGSITVGLANDGVAGVKSGTATISLSSDGTGTSGYGTTALTSQSIAVSGTVLAHSNASFASVSDGDTNSLAVDLGNWQSGSGTKSVAFSIFNLSNLGDANTAGLRFVSLAGSGDTAALASNADGFLGVLAADGSRSFLASLDTAAAGRYHAVYTLHLSDEDLPGATGQDLTLTLDGTVTAPEPATLTLAAAGFAGLLLRRRR